MKTLKKYVLILLVAIMGLLMAFATKAHATTYDFDSFTSSSDYGTKTQVSDNITNLKGNKEESGGMKVGPFSKASKTKLADGIKEETYVGLDSTKYANGELFEVSLALKEMKDGTEEYLTEAVVMTQKTEGGFRLTAGWAPEFNLTVEEDGVYTYRWNMYTEDGITYVKFTLLNYGEVVGTTGVVNLDNILNKNSETDSQKIAERNDVSVKYLWFCNIKAEYGVDVYATLPVRPEDEPKEPDTEEPTEEPKDEPTEQPVEEPTEEPVKEPAQEKDASPKTGVEGTTVMVITVVAVVAVVGLVVVNKKKIKDNM